MKIKTIVQSNPGTFDEQVNEMLKDGHLIEHRGILTGKDGSVFHYAQLVLPEQAAEPEPVAVDPFQALHIVKAACDAHKGPCNNCPLYAWCKQLDDCNDPTDWELPEVE